MGKVILGTTMSLDGFINDRNGDLSPLYPDLEALRKTDFLQESIRTTGTAVMGRRAYDLGEGDFTGYEYQVPIFLLTHRPPDKPVKGQNDKLTITFVTDGIASAIGKAKAAAGDKDVTVIGGASTAQQCIAAGLVDELDIGIFPVLLGQGLRFFDHLDTWHIELEQTQVTEALGVTYIRFRVVK
jgi:dihydrofolate reductase